MAHDETRGLERRPTERIPSSRKALFMVALVLLVGLALGLMGEAVARVRQWMKHGSLWSVEETFRIDPATGLRLPIANSTVGPIHINSHGFRSPELPSPKPPSMIRLAFVGSSTTYCAEVSSNEATWPHLVWDRLRATFPGARFDYVNAGVPGYGLDSELKNFELRVRPLRPDVVVIYEATNDLSFDTYQLAKARGLRFSRPGESRSRLSRYSFLWFLVEKNITVMLRQAEAGAESEKLHFDPRELSRGFEARLTSLVRSAQRVAPVVAVATFSPRLRRNQPRDEQVKAAVTSLYYMPYMTVDGLVDGFEEYNRVIRTVAAKTGALLIEGANRIPPDAEHYTDSVHFTDAGSRVMAARVSLALQQSPALRDLVRARSR